MLAACGATSPYSNASAAHHSSRHVAAHSGIDLGRSTTTHRDLLSLVARCMRHEGIAVPEPNAAGEFDLRGLDVRSPHFRAIDLQCYRSTTKELERSAATRLGNGVP